MGRWVAVAAALLILAAVNLSILNKERLLAEGRIIYLALVPVDPRSLMQGDYMALRFALAGEVTPLLGSMDSDGHVVVLPDGRGVATLRRIADGVPLVEGEVMIRYRLRDGQLKLATNAFFFQEGQGELYATARYGEFRVGSGGEAILTGLRDADLKRLGAL